MSFEAIPSRSPGRVGSQIRYFARIGSTNDYLLAQEAPADGLVIVTDLQTAGRGRGAHRWEAREGENLLFSFSLSLASSAPLLPLIPLFAALSVCEAADTVCAPGIGAKWPNDVLYREQKLCGILVESRLRGQSARVVTGIGVNVNQTSFPDELIHSSTSLARIAGRPVDRAALFGALLDRLNENLFQVERVEALERYRRRCTTIGRLVAFHRGQTERRGRAVGIDEQGRLLIEDGAATAAYLGSEVTHLELIGNGTENRDVDSHPRAW